MNATLATTRPCRSCSTDIYLLRNLDTGRWMPVDEKPSSAGIVKIDVYRTTCEVLTGDRLAAARADELTDLHQPHHRTCPDADRHRGPGKQTARLFDPEGLG